MIMIMFVIMMNFQYDMLMNINMMNLSMFMTIKNEYAFDDDEFFENYEHDEYEHEDDDDEYDK